MLKLFFEGEVYLFLYYFIKDLNEENFQSSPSQGQLTVYLQTLAQTEKKLLEESPSPRKVYDLHVREKEKLFKR